MSSIEALFAIALTIFIIFILKNVEHNHYVQKHVFYDCYHKKLQRNLLPIHRYEYSRLSKEALDEMNCTQTEYTYHYVKTLRKTN
jgi:hypothetical protein